MTIKDNEKILFEKWKAERDYRSFTWDGVFDEQTYLSQPLKILYVLKEADWLGLDADLQLIDWLLSEKSPTYWKTWNNIARWTQALLVGGDYQKHISKQDKTYWLKKIAFMELKKVPGGASSSNDEIRSFVEKDRIFLKEQICCYHPDIIICCGRGTGKNADLLYNYVFDKAELSEWKHPALVQKYNYFVAKINGKPVPVVSYVHPQMSFGTHDKFKRYYSDMIKIREELFGV